MKVGDINNDIKGLLNSKDSSKKNKYKLKNVLSNIFNTIERFENNSEFYKNDRDKLDVLKNVISDMAKDDDQKRIIRGDG
jgi:hypothetical protein